MKNLKALLNRGEKLEVNINGMADYITENSLHWSATVEHGLIMARGFDTLSAGADEESDIIHGVVKLAGLNIIFEY